MLSSANCSDSRPRPEDMGKSVATAGSPNTAFSSTGIPSFFLTALPVLVLALALFFSNLGATSLPSYDDAYYAQLAKEILQRGDPITLTYGGGISFQSSPLPLWLISLAYLVFGVGEYAARLPSALLAFSTVLMVYAFAHRRWGQGAAMTAAFILTTTPLFMRYARHAMADIPLAAFITAALLSLLEAERNPKWYKWFGVATGLAILTKSAMGVLPIIIAVIFFVTTGRIDRLKNKRFLAAVFIAVAIAAVWYVPVLVMHGETFINSHIGDYLATHTVSGHQSNEGIAGLFHYVTQLPLQYLPWTLLLVPALFWGAAELRRRPGVALLWLAVTVPVLLLSLISTRYTRYLMPVFPSAALLITAVLSTRLGQKWKDRVFRWLSVASIAAALAVIILPFSLSEDRNDEVKSLSRTAKTLASEDVPLVNYKLNFYRYQNPMLFYADRFLTQPRDSASEVWQEMAIGAGRLGIATRAGFDEIATESPPGQELKIEDFSGDLVLFSITSLDAADWKSEIEQLLPAISAFRNSDWLGCFKLPDAEIQAAVNSEAGMNLLQSEFRPRPLFREMERKGTSLGLAWSKEFASLRKLPSGLPEVKWIAETENLVLFLKTPDRPE